MDIWRARSQRATYILLVASATCILPGLLDIGSTIFLVAALGSLTGALLLIREELTALPVVVGYDLGWYARDSWVGALVGTAIVLVSLGATPAELRALGALAGLVGVVNYFLRPLYLFVAEQLLRLLHGSR